MRTLDRKYLASHPEGDEKAELSFSGTVPASVEVPLNLDGTRPSATLKVTADNYMDAILALDALHDDEAEQFLWELLEQAVPENVATRISSPEEAAAVLKAATHEVVIPFRTFTVEMAIESTDSFGIKTSSDVTFELTTPNIGAGVALAMSISTPQRLGQTMIGLSPEVDMDDEADENEVLVVS